MKPTATLLLLLISTMALTQAEGSCKNGCLSCRTNGEVEWCLACSGAKHVVTNATNGRCEGAPLANCVFQTQDMQNNQLCFECELGYGLIFKEVDADAEADGNRRHFEGYTCKAIDNSTMATTGYFYTKKDEGATEKFVAQTCRYGYKVNQNKEKCTLSAEHRPYIEHCLVYNAGGPGCDLCDGKRLYDRIREKCIDDNTGILGINGEFYFRGKWTNFRLPNVQKGFTVKEARPNALNNFRNPDSIANPDFYRIADFSWFNYYQRSHSKDYHHFTSEKYGDVGMKVSARGYVACVWALVMFLGILVFSK